MTESVKTLLSLFSRTAAGVTAMDKKLAKNMVPAQSPTPGSPPSRRKRRITDWGKKGRRATNVLGVVSISN